MLIACFSVAKLLLHLVFAGKYGYMGDELYFIECGRHPSFGYVDHAPMVPWVARASTWLFGGSLTGLRFFSALAGAVTVALAMVLARRMGGSRFAQVAAGLCALIAPAYLRMGSILCLPAFETLWLTAASLLIVILIQRNDPRLWLPVAALVGIGLLTKHTMLYWALGIAVGVAATPLRRHARGLWMWAGGALVAALFLPNLVWQSRNGWPTLEFLRHINEDQLSGIPRSLFLLGQVLYMHPLALPVWGAGLFSLFTRDGERYRVLGWLYLTALAILLVNHAKPYYLVPAYPPLLAAGAAWWERRLALRGLRRAPVAVTAALVLGGVLVAPLSLPILPLGKADGYVQRLFGFALADSTDLTSEFHEQVGWREQATAVARVYRGLRPQERNVCGILAHDYSQASAINVLGADLGLPRAVSGHMTYYLWGPGDMNGAVVIAVGYPPRELERLFAEVRWAESVRNSMASQLQRDVAIYVCRGSRRPIQEMWPSLKRYSFMIASR